MPATRVSHIADNMLTWDVKLRRINQFSEWTTKNSIVTCSHKPGSLAQSSAALKWASELYGSAMHDGSWLIAPLIVTYIDLDTSSDVLPLTLCAFFPSRKLWSVCYKRPRVFCVVLYHKGIRASFPTSSSDLIQWSCTHTHTRAHAPEVPLIWHGRVKRQTTMSQGD